MFESEQAEEVKDWVKGRRKPQDGHNSAANDGRLLTLLTPSSEDSPNLPNAKMSFSVATMRQVFLLYDSAHMSVSGSCSISEVLKKSDFPKHD